MIFSGLVAFFLLEYVRPSSYYPFLIPLHLNSLVPLATTAASVLTSGHATASRLARDLNIRVVFSMLGLLWLSFVTADVQEIAWTIFTVVFGFALITWVIASEVRTVAKVKGVIVALIAAHVIVAFMNPLLFTDPEVRHYLTSGSFLGDGNDFALSIVIILPLCFFLLLDSKKTIVKALWAGMLLVLVAGVVVTQSRGGTIGLGCMAIYYWTKSQKKIQTGAVVAVVVVLILALAPGNYFNRMKMMTDTTEGSASARLTAWGVAIDMALDHPLVGVGAGHFGSKIGNEYRPAEFIGSGMTAHSIYFLALGELGFPGLALLLVFMIGNLRANATLVRELQARESPTKVTDLQLLSSLSASVIALGSAGAFLSALYYPHVYMLGGILSAGRFVVQTRMATTTVAVPQQANTNSELHWALRPPPRRGISNEPRERLRMAQRAGRGSTLQARS